MEAELKLKNCKTCVGCYAYENGTSGHYGYCVLGFDVIQLISPFSKNLQPTDEKYHCGRTSIGEYWTFLCKPGEPCLKPMTIKNYLRAFKLRHPALT